jgi:cellulose biosynthesis protein BcsQ
MMQDSQVVTFYSYKGGTGRTMMLANVAWILASYGKRVLAVDWDLEAPGLHRYFHPFLIDKECRSSPGVMDMVWDVSVSSTKSKDADPDPEWYRKYADVLEYAVSLRWDFPDEGTLDLLPAGRQGVSYGARVNSFSWKNFYERYGGHGFLDDVVKSMRSEYDYVLIDSRTGVSDTSGICTVHLPDALVACFTLNTQSIEGCAAVVDSIKEQRADRPLRVFPVPMRLEDGEKKKLDAGLDYAYERFGSFLQMTPEQLGTYWGAVAVPYMRFYAYEEVLAPFGDRAQQAQALLPSAEKLTYYLTDGSVTAAAPIPDSDRRRWLAEFERVGEADGPLELGLDALHDGDVELAEQHFLRAWQDGDSSGDTELAADASHQLSAVARKKGNLGDAELWYRKAVGLPSPPQSDGDAEQATIAGFGRGLPAEGEDQVLSAAWRIQQQWSRVANTAQQNLSRARLWNLTLLVLGAVAAVLAAQTWFGLYSTYSTVNVVCAAISAALLAIAAFFQGLTLTADNTARWTDTRAASGALEAELFRYLAKVKPYRGADRVERLQAQLDTIQTRVGPLLVDQQRVSPDDRPLPPVQAFGGYLTVRAQDQATWHRAKAAEYMAKARILRFCQLGATAVGAILAAIAGLFPETHLAAWTAAATTIAAAFAAYLAATEHQRIAASYASTADQLERLILGVDPAEENTDRQAQFVADVERVLAAQNEGWVDLLSSTAVTMDRR